MLYLSKVDKENHTISILDTSKGIENQYKMSDIPRIKKSGKPVVGISTLEPCLPALTYGRTIQLYADKYNLFNRDTAILVIEGKWYESDTHQFCLEDYLVDKGTSLKEKYNLSLDDESIDGDMMKVAEITHQMFNDNEAFGFDIYSDMHGNRYLAAHFVENLIACYDMMKQYATENNLTLCIHEGNGNEVLREVVF
jgi:hypothetical protein